MNGVLNYCKQSSDNQYKTVRVQAKQSHIKYQAGSIISDWNAGTFNSASHWSEILFFVDRINSRTVQYIC